MNHEGMVHALEETRRLLKLDGSLVNILPLSEVNLIEVHHNGSILFAERIEETGDEDVHRAENEVKRALDRELFVIDKTDEFEFRTYGSSVSQLLAYWEEQNAYEDGHKAEEVMARDEHLYAQVEKILNELGNEAEVAIHERVRIAVLRPVK